MTTRRTYHPPAFGQQRLLPLVSGLALAALLFLLLPLTQFLARPAEEPPRAHQVDAVLPPPPPPPPPPPEPPPPPDAVARPRAVAAPEMSRPQPQLSLQELRLALDVPLGQIQGDFGLNFDLAPGAVAEVEAYQVEDLDEAPVFTRQTPPRYPHEMRRAGISGEVVLEFIIEPDGSISNIQVVESTHRAFEVAAIEAARTWRSSPPLVRGEPVRAFRRLRIPFEMN